MKEAIKVSTEVIEKNCDAVKDVIHFKKHGGVYQSGQILECIETILEYNGKIRQALQDK